MNADPHKGSQTQKNNSITVLPIEELPEEYQRLHAQFHTNLNNKEHQEARKVLRRLIGYYIDQGREIPVSIEVGYGKLLMLEEIERNKVSKNHEDT
jgi:hypothetical protein